MKKILALILALAMIFTLAACGGEPASTTPEASSTPDEVVSPPEETPDEPEETPNEPEEVPEKPTADYSKAGTYKYYEDKGDMASFNFAYKLATVRDWLFEQSR